MSKTLYTVVLFPSTSYTLRAEKVLQQVGVVTKLIPVPRHISSDCGVCLRIHRGEEEVVCQALNAAGVEFEGICEL